MRVLLESPLLEKTALEKKWARRAHFAEPVKMVGRV
jgi:hypothetical protein